MNVKKINILYLIATLDVGGAERQLVELVKRIDKEKFHPVVCCLTRGGPLENELKQAKIEYFILGKKFKFDFSVIFKLIRILKQKNIHILHTWMFTSNSFGRMAGVFDHIPIIVAEERGVDIWKNRFHLFTDKILSHFTDKIICVSEGVKKFYHQRAYIPLDKMIIIYNGIEITPNTKIDIERKKQEFSVKKDELVISFIGRLVPSKGIKYLLYAIPQIVKDFPNVKFLIVGEGLQDSELKRLASELKINNYIIFTGLRTDIKEILTITYFLVHPSFIEGLSNVIMEAMLAEKPVIATHIPGNDELVIDGETGLLIPPKDANVLASAIITLLKNPEEGKRMGIKGRQRIEKYFSINETVRKTEELYDTLIQLKIHGN